LSGSTEATAAANRARRVLVIAWLAVIGLLLGWHASRLSTAAAVVATAVTAGPWLALAPALWRGNRLIHVLALVLASLTMAYALTEVLTNRGAHGWASATLFAALGLFLAIAFWLRLSRPARP